MASCWLMSFIGCARRLRTVIRIFSPAAWLLTLFGLIILLLLHQKDNVQKSRHAAIDPFEGVITEEDHIMVELGFVHDPVLYPHSHHQSEDLPVFIATIQSDDLHSFHRFLGSFRLHFRQRKLIVYDLGLTEKELKMVRHTCQCLVRTVHWNRYPPHVKDKTLKAYRPILIQETLREFGIVFWCHHEMRFNGSDIESLRARAEAIGLVAWPAQRYPTSAYTHDGMLQRFNVERQNVYFLHMAEPDSAIYANTYRLHHRLLKPWVRCALNPECLAPVGSQYDGCDLTRNPRYRYTGCHRYDSSAFNLLLGQMFYYDDSSYIPTQWIFYREKVLPPVRHHSLSASRTVLKQSSYNESNSFWEVQQMNKYKEPILFKRKKQ